MNLHQENKITINPLLPEGVWDYFMLDNLLYKGQELTIVYDADGKRYNKGKGIKVFIDGSLIKNETDMLTEK